MTRASLTTDTQHPTRGGPTPRRVNTSTAGYQGPALDESRLQAARLWIAHHRPYYAAALFRCAIVTTDQTETLAIDDRWRIYVNPQCVNGLAVPEFAAALVHEINHVLRDHAGRSRSVAIVGDQDRHRWNLAGDAEINDDLRDDGLAVDPSWIYPSTFGFADHQIAEWYYDRLPRTSRDVPGPPTLGGAPRDAADSDSEVPHRRDAVDGPPASNNTRVDSDDPSDSQRSCGSGAGARAMPGELGAEDLDAPGLDPLERQITRTEVARAVEEHARSRGDVPGGLVRWAGETLRPVIDWRRVLAGNLRHALALVHDHGDHSYRRLSRRDQAVPGVRFPGTIRPVAQVAVIVDTSGSMSDAEVTRALSEVQGVLRSASVAEDRVTVLTVDVRVAAVRRVADARQITTMGRGGTDMRVGIAEALARRPRPDLVIVLTDGYTPWPSLPPRRCQMIVGLVGTTRQELGAAAPPAWARCVEISS